MTAQAHSQSYVAERSTNLVDWSPVDITEQILSTDPEIQQTLATVPTAGAPNKFLRIRVTLIQP